MTAAGGTRLAALVEAAWKTFEAVARTAPEELRKGPRGGGRDTSKIVDHVIGSEQAYASEHGHQAEGVPDERPRGAQGAA